MTLCKRSNSAFGFTLIELLLGICLVGLVLTFAVPTYGHWIASRQLANHAEFLIESLNLARTEAVKRGLRVNLCKTADRRECADAGGWESGWIMFVDANKSGEIEATEDVLHVEGPAGNGITVRANRPLADYVSYTSFGFARQLNGALQMGTFVVCKPGQNAIHVVLANSGRTRIDRTAIRCP
jgi:type IV fimbrial biogenesis protein FimT